MKYNVFRNVPVDPMISHMRIEWEEGIRKQTETHWRNTISYEIMHSCDSFKTLGYMCNNCNYFFGIVIYKKEN